MNIQTIGASLKVKASRLLYLYEDVICAVLVGLSAGAFVVIVGMATMAAGGCK